MKTNMKKYIAALAFAPVLLSSCSADFLNEVNPNEQTPATFWINETNAYKGLSAVYSSVRHMSYGYYGGYEGILHYQMRADDLYPTRGEEPWEWETLAFTNTSNTRNTCWGSIYKGIQLANEFLYNVPNVPMDESKKSQWIGEAYFFRGFWYFRVACDFNEGVIRTLPQEGDPESHGLSSHQAVLEQAVADLKEAKARLPKTRTADENGRITQGAAIAMLGKAYLWLGKAAEAKTELASIMSGYGYDLTPEYEDNFRDDTEFNEESIWEINYGPEGNIGESPWADSDGDNSFMGNTYGHYFGPHLEGSGATGQNRGGGWYKMQPSPYLVKQFIAEPRQAGSDSHWDKRMYTTCFFKYSDYETEKADETFYDGFTFDQIFKYTALPSHDDKYRVKGALTSPAYPDINGKEGRFIWKKLTPWWSKTGCSMYSNPYARITNYRIMRFAEVLFLHAEACLETNDAPSAVADLKRIRQRAGLTPCKAGVSESDKDAVMEELRNQKLLEFAGENIRWDDLVRWYGSNFEQFQKIMKDRKTDSKEWKKLNLDPDAEDDGTDYWGYEPTGRIINTQYVNFNDKKYLYFPIPQSEVDANQALEQTPDWR